MFQIGKTDIAYLLRQGHLGGEEGEVASLSMCSGNPDGGHAVEGSVVYVPCPNGVTAVKVSTKPPYLKQLWTDNDGAAGAPIIADGLVWTIGGNAVHGLNPANGHEVVSIPFGGTCEPLPDAVGRRWPAAPSRHRPGLRLHGSGRAAAAASRSLVTMDRPAQPAYDMGLGWWGHRVRILGRPKRAFPGFALLTQTLSRPLPYAVHVRVALTSGSVGCVARWGHDGLDPPPLRDLVTGSNRPGRRCPFSHFRRVFHRGRTVGTSGRLLTMIELGTKHFHSEAVGN